MKKNLFILSVATLLMVGCDSINSIDSINPDEIRIVAKVDSTRATATSFEEGDKIALYAVEYDGDSVAELQVAGNFINNEALTYNASAWVGGAVIAPSIGATNRATSTPYIRITSRQQ